MKYKIHITDKINELFYSLDENKIDLHNDYRCIKIELINFELHFSFKKIIEAEYKIISNVDSLSIIFIDVSEIDASQEITSTLHNNLIVNLDLGRFLENGNYVDSREGSYYFSVAFDDGLSISFEAKEMYFDLF
ncbi:MAG: hypothetical protein Q8M29_14375 [Bacteroidota bacterium]|nr:hypothetical protein [Bacteroidota bacterium]